MDGAWIFDKVVARDVASTLILAVALVIARFALVRAVSRRAGFTVEQRRWWLVNIRNGVILLLLAGLIFIWAHELRTFAVSLVALAVAFVVATKELILCFSGAVLRAATHAYSIGDRIEIGDMRGDVVDQNLFVTTLMEIGPGKTSHQFTGRALVIPNSMLLQNPLVNETFIGEYVVHLITVPLSAHDDWQHAERYLLEAATAECAPFMDEARRYMAGVEARHALDMPSVEPRVSIEIPEPGKINLLLRIPAPARRKGRLEQAILRHFLSHFRPQPGTVPATPSPATGEIAQT